MADLNLDVNFRDHPKTRRLTAMLGKDSDWLVVKLWLYVARIHPDGKLKGYSAQEIEGIAEWIGTPGVFIEAMEKVEWIEKDSKNHYQLSGWKDHQGHLLAFKRRGRIAAKSRWDKLKPKEKTDASSMPQAMLNVQTSNALTVRNGTVLTDVDWRGHLQKADAYKHINIEAEFQKAFFWCEQRGRKPTRRFFLGWINKIPAPMAGPKSVQSNGLKEYESRRAA